MRLLIPLFSPATGTWGGLTRVISVAEAAKKEGHQVAFCASGSLESILKRRGYLVFPIPQATFLGLPPSISHRIEKRSPNVSLPVRPGKDFGNIWFVLMISGMAKYDYLLKLVSAERQAAKEFQADMLFTDLDPGTFLLSQIENLPVAAAYQTPMAQGFGSLPWMLLNRAVGKVLKKYHLPSQKVDAVFHGSRVLKIIPSVPVLEGTNADREDVCYVGHLLGDIQSDSRFRPEPEKRYVFVYVGTGAVRMGVLKSILPQVFPAGGKTICLVGGQGFQAVEKIGAVEFRPYVPAADVLPFCDWTLCHGGQNTIIQSLLAGVPLLVFPGPIFERRFNARKVQAAGAGKMGELPDFTVSWFETEISKQAEYAAGASSLKQQIQSFGGPQAAIHAIQRWSQKR